MKLQNKGCILAQQLKGPRFKFCLSQQLLSRDYSQNCFGNYPSKYLSSCPTVERHGQARNLNTHQRCNHGEIFGATFVIVGQNLPPLVGIGLRYLKIQMRWRTHRSPLQLRPTLGDFRNISTISLFLLAVAPYNFYKFDTKMV